MNFKKAFPYIVLVILAVALLCIKRCNSGSDPSTQKNKNTTAAKPAGTNSNTANNTGLNRNAELFFTKHARCRMQCRHITQAEVKDILQTGNINYNKSDLQNAQGAEYAVEGITNDKQHVRIIFAPKQKHTSVVTVIDLDTDWTCPSCN